MKKIYKLEDMIKVIVFHDNKHLNKLGLDRTTLDTLENALRNGNWKIVKPQI